MSGFDLQDNLLFVCLYFPFAPLRHEIVSRLWRRRTIQVLVTRVDLKGM